MSENSQIEVHGYTGGFNAEQFRLITDFVMKGATPDEIAVFAQVCAKTKLDPFRKQIHPVKRWSTDDRRYIWTYQTGIDGYRAIANRTGLLAGIDDAIFTPENENEKNPQKASVTVWKLVAGQRVPFTASARWSEYVQTTKEGHTNSMWKKMPFSQLAKCAEALALRKAFPEDLGGVHSNIEMEQTDNDEPFSEPQNDAPQQQQPRRVTSGTAPAYQKETTAAPRGTTRAAAKSQPQETSPAPAPAPSAKEAVIVDAVEVTTPNTDEGPDPRAPYMDNKWREFAISEDSKPLGELPKEARNELIRTATGECRHAIDAMLIEALSIYLKQLKTTAEEMFQRTTRSMNSSDLLSAISLARRKIESANLP